MAKEEVIYEKEESGDKKIDVMKGKNTIKVNPSLGESIKAELCCIICRKDPGTRSCYEAARG